MLTRFRINNFKSHANSEFRPIGLNLLIGSNNAGKTNLCAALRFLGLTSQQSLDSAILAALGERWNLTNFHVEGPAEIEFEADCILEYEGQEIQFAYSLLLRVEKRETGETQSLRVRREELRATGGRFMDTPLLKNEEGVADMLHEEGFVEERPNSPFYAKAKFASDATVLSQLYELENNPRAIFFRKFLRSWGYYNFSPEALRSPDVVRDDATLLFNGANLSRALFALHNEKPRLEKKIIEIVKRLEPRLDFFSFSSPDPEHVYLFLEVESEHRVSARSISDGTIRFMAMAHVILMAEQAVKTLGFAPLTVIEEPENGLYVGHLKPLIEPIDLSGQTGQFVFTSHSPYFIDLFDNNLEGIHLVKPGHPSSVIVKTDPARIRKFLDEMPLGELHFREMLA